MNAEPTKPTPPAKYVALNDDLYRYLTQQRSRVSDPLLEELRSETESLGEAARMLISREQGDFLSLLVRALGVCCAVEVGTFTGYSALCIARGLREGGKLFCFDLNAEWTGIGRRYWAREGLSERIELQLGDAHELLRKWEPPSPIDFAFIDADKPGYDAYFEMLLPRMKQDGLFIFDNMVWDGRIIEKPLTHPDGVALDRLNGKLANDPRVESVLLPIADGLHFARKR